MPLWCLLAIACAFAATNTGSSSDKKFEVLVEGEYVTEILFRHKGSLSGAVTYGHLTFENDLTEIDDSHMEAKNIIQQYSNDLMDNLNIEIKKAEYNQPPHPWYFYGTYWQEFVSIIDEYIRTMPKELSYLEKLQLEEEIMKNPNNTRPPPTPKNLHYENFKKGYLANPSKPEIAQAIEVISFYETACLYERGVKMLVADRVNSLIPYEDIVKMHESGLNPVTKYGKLKKKKVEMGEIIANGFQDLAELKEEWRDYKKAIGLEEVQIPQPKIEISEVEREVEEFTPRKTEKLEEVAIERQKRFWPILVAIGVGTGIAVGVTGLVTSSVAISKMNAIEEVARQNMEQDEKLEVIVANIQKNNEASAAAETKLHDLNFTMTWAAKELMKLDDTDQLLHVETNIKSIINTIANEQKRVIQGTTDVLHKQLSPSWVQLDDALASMSNLREKAMKEGFDLPITDVTWLYNSPCGCLVHKNGKFITFVAVPLHIKNQQLELYEYIKIPVSLNESVHSVTIEPEGTYLGVNPDRDGFLILQEKEIDKCPLVGDVYLCENRNYLHKHPERFCLSSLFWKIQKAAHQTCKTALATDNTQIIQTAQHSFYIFHPQEFTLTIKCPHRIEEYYSWRGSRLVDLKIGCRGFGIDYDLISYPSFTVDNIIEASNISWTVRQLTLDLSKNVIETYMPTPPKHSVLVEDLVSQVRMIEKNSRLIGINHYPLSFATSSFGGFITVLVIIITLCSCCYCCRGPIIQKLKQFGTNSTADKNPSQYEPLPASRRSRHVRYPSLPDYLDTRGSYMQLQPIRNPTNAESQTVQENYVRVV